MFWACESAGRQNNSNTIEEMMRCRRGGITSKSISNAALRKAIQCLVRSRRGGDPSGQRARPSFDALPGAAKDLVYRRLWRILTGELPEERYRMPLGERQAIAEILVATKEGIPKYFRDQIVK